MGQTEKMLRVSKSRPCPVCGKPDWCLRTADDSSAICARIEDGSKKRCGEAGWLHILSGKPFAEKRRFIFHREIPRAWCTNIRFSALCKQYQKNLTPYWLHTLAQKLNLASESLVRLGMGWDGEAYTFPMSSAEGHITGIRRRIPNGLKKSVPDSKIGLFIPDGLSRDGMLLICEGPTDTAAALCLGFDAVGRPNCNSGNDIVMRFAAGRSVVIVSDNDNVGRTGANALARQLLLYCPSVHIVYPPDGYRDLRNWFAAGLTAETLRNHIEKASLIKAVIQYG